MVRRAFALVAVAALFAFSGQAFAEDKAGTHEGKVVKAEAGKLTMSDKDGKNEHTHAVPADAKVSCDGKECKLTELKAGSSVKVTTEKKGDKVVVTKVEAKTT
ncbi:MAG: hypothetical protein K8U57_35110 [Planctomycetes bacterium]|nr:hypothetical protein [Planctomycetota bacterium]